MRSAILAFAAGAACLQLQPTLPPASTMLACATATIVVCLLLHGLPRMITTGLLLGFCWAAFIAHLTLSDALPHDDEGRDITVIGAIASLPHRFDGGVRFQFDVAHTETRNATVPPKIVLS